MARRSLFRSFRQMFLTQQRVPLVPCPHCAAALDGATGLSPDAPARPTPGTLTLCAECERWLVFTDTLGLRLATADDVERVDPDLRRLVRASMRFGRKTH